MNRRAGFDLLARLTHQLLKPRVDDLLPFSSLVVFERPAAVLQLHRHIPPFTLRKAFDLLAPLRRPALDVALEGAHKFAGPIRVERRQGECVVPFVGAIGVFCRCEVDHHACATATVFASAVKIGGVARNRSNEHPISYCHSAVPERSNVVPVW